MTEKINQQVIDILVKELNICFTEALEYNILNFNYSYDSSSVCSNIFPGEYTCNSFEVTNIYNIVGTTIGKISFIDVQTQLIPSSPNILINENGNILIDNIGNVSYIYSFPSQLQFQTSFPPDLKYVFTEMTNKSGIFLKTNGFILIIPFSNGSRQVFIIYK